MCYKGMCVYGSFQGGFFFIFIYKKIYIPQKICSLLLVNDYFLFVLTKKIMQKVDWKKIVPNFNSIFSENKNMISCNLILQNKILKCTFN